MATIEARGYVNKFERKTSAKGTTYTRFQLSVQQKRKDAGGQEVKENLYFTCVDFSGQDPPGLHEGERGLTCYVGVKGYVTLTTKDKDGRSFLNVDVTVKEYEAIEQKGEAKAPKAAAAAPPADPFALEGT